jgi:hypothetical protein
MTTSWLKYVSKKHYKQQMGSQGLGGRAILKMIVEIGSDIANWL